MRKLSFLLLLLPFLVLGHTLHSQTECDTLKAAAILAQARSSLLSQAFLEAPGIALSALPFVEKCQGAAVQMAAIYEQVAIWETSFEQFEQATDHLKNAKLLLTGNTDRMAELNLLQARLGIASRNNELTIKALDDVFNAPKRLGSAVYAQAWMLKAKLYFFLTKPELGMACLDSAAIFIELAPSLQLKGEAMSIRVELDLIAGDFKHAVSFADSALTILSNEQETAMGEIKCRLLETSGRLARAIIGINEGHKRLIQAQQLAESLPPYLRVRLLPSALSQLIYSSFEQAGEETSDSIFIRLEKMIQPERISHQTYLAEALSNRARVYKTLGQFEQAITYAEQSIGILKALPGENSQRISANYTFMASSYLLMHDYEPAIAAGERALNLRKKLQPTHIGLGATYNELLQIYLSAKDTIKAKAILLEFEQLIASQKDKSNLEYYTYFIAFGWLNYWREAGQHLKGIAQAETFLKVSGSKARMRGIITADLEYRICDAYQEGGQYQMAFERIEPIVARLKKRYQESGSIFYEHYSWVLAQSAYIALDVYEQLGDTSMLRIAETRCTEAEDLLFALRQRDPKEGKRSFVTDEFLYNCLLRIRATLFQMSGKQSHLERAFAVSESYQMVDIQRLLSENQALHFGGVSLEAAKEEHDLQKKMTDLEGEKSGLRFQAPGPETDQLTSAIETKLSSTRQQYETLLNDLEKKFPDYYQLKYKLPVISLAAAQKEMLGPGQCMLKIYPFKDTAICLLIRPDTTLMMMTGFSVRTQNDLTIFLDGIRNFPTHSALPESAFLKGQQEFTDASARLYQSLLAPLESWFTKEIIVVAADNLSVLPFEALLKTPTAQCTRPTTWDYWGNNHVISYASSATIFQFVQHRRPFRSDLQNALVMAPYFSGDLKAAATDDFASRTRSDFFTPLPHTGQEALAVAQLLDGKAFSGTECAPSNFLAKAESHKVLHLATHASAGGKGRPAFISFQPLGSEWRSAMLFESDIYALRLSADLVTLSACETALGKNRYGDGLHGLSRAFTCAGARNIVASLWSVNDASTKDLMILFYKEIKLGASYNNALANAKRTFIKENRLYAHPYYWAGFVLNGR